MSTYKFSKLIFIRVLLLLMTPNCGPIFVPDPLGLKDASRSPVAAWVCATISSKIWTLLLKPILILFFALFFSFGCKSLEYLRRNGSFFSRYSFPFNLGLGKGAVIWVLKFYLISRYVLLAMLAFNMTMFLRKQFFETPFILWNWICPFKISWNRKWQNNGDLMCHNHVQCFKWSSPITFFNLTIITVI